MKNKDIEKIIQDSDNDEDQLMFQTDAQRKRYQSMLANEKHDEHIEDEDEITTVIGKIGHRIWHRMFE